MMFCISFHVADSVLCSYIETSDNGFLGLCVILSIAVLNSFKSFISCVYIYCFGTRLRTAEGAVYHGFRTWTYIETKCKTHICTLYNDTRRITSMKV